MMRNKQFQWVFVLVSLVCVLGLGIISMQGILASTFRTNVVLKATFTLDNVPISVQSSVLPTTHFGISDPGAAIQLATAVTYTPYQELQIITVPYGFRSATEEVPIAQPGQETAYRDVLHNFRVKQGGNPQLGPIAILFSKQVTSQVSHVQLHLNTLTLHQTMIVEWVAEAESRLWIIRFSIEEAGNDTNLLSSMSSLVVGSSALNPLTTIGKLSHATTHSTPILGSASILPAPPWWNGDTMCDKISYIKNTTATPFILHDASGKKAIYRGVQACGPLPMSVSTPDNYVQFIPNPNKTTEQEWECTELVKRYLLLAYDLPTVQNINGGGGVNGSQVVSNYAAYYGSTMKAIPNNGTPHVVPLPGDVFSYGDTSTFGHTSIVTSAKIDNTTGNGTVSIIDQNGSSTGMAQHTVTAWVIDGSNDGGTISAWLTSRTWKITKSPSPLGYSRLSQSGVAAISSNNVWTVGSYSFSVGSQAFIEHWNGTKWSLASSPAVNFSGLLSIAAVSTNDIWVVGGSNFSNQTAQTLTEHWNGTSWSVIPSPNVTGYDVLEAVAVVNSTDVWAVGYSGFAPNPGYQTLTEHWDGTSWSVISSPNPFPQTGENFLYSVTAIASNDVWAVGFDDSGTGSAQTLTIHWDGSQWNVIPSPNPGSAGNQLYSVSADASNDVWAVGNSSAGNGAITMRWQNNSWTVIPNPTSSAGSNNLSAVVARSSTDVWAVGYDYPSTANGYQTLILHWDGLQWNIMPSPNSSLPSNILDGLAFTNSPDVWAVGYDYSSSGSYGTLIEHYG